MAALAFAGLWGNSAQHLAFVTLAKITAFSFIVDSLVDFHPYVVQDTLTSSNAKRND